MASLATIATVASIAGTALSVVGTISAGQQQSAAYEYQAKQQEMQADEAKAASQREAAAQRRQGDFILSKQRAGVAAAGGNVAEPSVIDIMSDTSKEADLAARTQLYKGEQQARGYQDAAAISRVNASNAKTNSYFGAAGDLFKGVTSMYDRFGKPQMSTSFGDPLASTSSDPWAGMRTVGAYG
ncbi:MAG: hypothetical protein ACTHJQ_25895 [Rhizobiaceae bacterium]